MSDKINPVKRFLKVWFTPAAKLSEPEIAGLIQHLKLICFALAIAVLVFAVRLARFDRGESAILQAADWLSRLPLVVATFLLAAFGWFLFVQTVDSLRLGRWSFHWNRHEAGDKLSYRSSPDDENLRAAKTLAWGIFLGLAFIGACLIFSKALGA